MKSGRPRFLFQSIGHSFSTFLFSAFILVVLLQGVNGQVQPRQQRRQFVEGMLEQLIESQLSPSERQNQRSSQINARASDPAPSLERNVVSSMRDIRENCAGLAQEISNLAHQLQGDASRTSGVRSYVGEALRVSAAATLLSRRSNQTWDRSMLQSPYQQLDQEWRLLAFRLGKFRDLSYEARRIVQRSNTLNDRLGPLFDVTPQVNRQELARHIADLSGNLLNLIEDIDMEVDDPEQRTELLLDGRRVFAQARRLDRMVNGNAAYDSIRTDYREFRKLWSPFANKIRILQDRYLVRQLRRIQVNDREVQELLWMPAEVDQQEIIYLTQALQQDTEGLLDGISLRQLAQLTDSRDRIVSTAGEFYSACDDFVECVNNGDSQDTLAELYYYLDEEWQEFSNVVQVVNTREARQKRREIDRSISDLRDMLGVRMQVDHGKGIRLAASLENLARHFDTDVRRIFSAGGQFNREFRQKCSKASQDFYETAKQLHAEMAGRANPGSLNQRVDQLSQQWETLVAYSTHFPRSDQQHLSVARRRMTPLLVEVQAMFRDNYR